MTTCDVSLGGYDEDAPEFFTDTLGVNTTAVRAKLATWVRTGRGATFSLS